MEHVTLRVEDRIATLSFARPDRLNAFTDTMEAELIEALDAIDADDEVRVVVLTGEGGAFCAGMDLSESSDAFTRWRTSPSAPEGTVFEVPGEELPMRRDGGGRVVLRLFDLDKPVIAAVNGPAVGVGATITLPCDVRLASERARFGFVFNRRGFVPESCSTWFLPRVVPMQTALEWVYTGRVFDADEALAKGLVRDVYAEDELLPAAYALAREIADNTAPVSTALARRMMWRMLGAEHPVVAHTAETIGLNLRGVSRDARDGIAAFLEKRDPVFTDRVPADVPDVFASFPAPEFDPAALSVARTSESASPGTPPSPPSGPASAR
ncbi:crotonase/enoyl-CoA hydratase family protein [Nocardioides sp. LHD-245]|uniref:crotonase/enoyl-CoA hydratase family protein n=1 Tax=Nocardioides sp. LHD-245 TaxID=3051387 RepID=UPI0027E129AB|nr:crotonase/enoyl-CoA hydratase family protein [Nocardioides sp. LHD-245]